MHVLARTPAYQKLDKEARSCDEIPAFAPNPVAQAVRRTPSTRLALVICLLEQISSGAGCDARWPRRYRACVGTPRARCGGAPPGPLSASHPHGAVLFSRASQHDRRSSPGYYWLVGDIRQEVAWQSIRPHPARKLCFLGV